ncbi:hypothetical protein IW261DRAFT_1533243 [Armillaria novae-zelandiae]|uniref:Uncharacterized protein n=1 Tax=Armillaria novae-zelandiae TaxID=153914 RepID=A0AA39N837_9AGAR|nr:hypothetical protein IW261DRAFT_1533243 [Armillaria novae-zelandiae]
MSLEIGGLYIMLFGRHQPGTYHWGIYHHLEVPTDKTSCRKSWIVESGETSHPLQSSVLVGAIKIGYADPAHRRTLGTSLGEVTCTSPSPDIPFTCRIWVLMAVNRLMDLGAVRCDSVKALEAEAIAFANQHASTRGVPPRPILRSTVCKF